MERLLSPLDNSFSEKLTNLNKRLEEILGIEQSGNSPSLSPQGAYSVNAAGVLLDAESFHIYGVQDGLELTSDVGDVRGKMGGIVLAQIIYAPFFPVRI